MNNITRTFSVVLCFTAGAAAFTASRAQDAAKACPSVTSLQKRIVERADQGIDSLRRFIWMTNTIYGVDMAEVQESLDAWRAAVTCQNQVARADEEREATKQVVKSDR